MSFVLFPWHTSVLQDFIRQSEQGRLGHAWMITGVPGVGKLQFCKTLAQWLFCQNRTAGQPCGICQDCHLFEVGNHPDWQLLVPEKKQITIGQVRELISFAQNTSQRGIKVLVVAPAESMNINAANALLKLLEEPPPGTILLLVCHQTGQLMATLRSRCQEMALALPESEVAEQWLTEHGAREPVRLLQKAQGSPLRALDLMENNILQEQGVILEQLQTLLQGTLAPVQAAKLCEKFSIQTSIEYLLACCRDLLASLQSGFALHDQELQPLLELLMAAGTGHGKIHTHAELVSQLHLYYQYVMKTYKTILAPNNANAQLIMESLFGGWVHMYRSVRANTARPTKLAQG